MDLDIYRETSIWLTIRIDDNTRLINQLLNEDVIRLSFNSHIFLDVAIGDYIVYGGIIYHINNLPNIRKDSSNSFYYDIIFESERYELLKTQFMDLDGNSDFYLVGNLETFIDLIITNMNREHTDWTKGTCTQTNTDYKLLNFSKSNCMQVLQRLCKEFEGEFYFVFELIFSEGAKLPYYPSGGAVIGYKPVAEAEYGYMPAGGGIVSYTKKIYFTDKAGSDSGLTFLYHQGLRNIQRTTLSEKNIITRLYAFGSEKNLASDYRNHSRRLKFVVEDKSYLEKNTDKYGTIEHTEIFNDIYPHREGTISSVDAEDITKFTDNGMDFNLNDFLLPGVTAKLHFNSGNLGGYEFEIYNYNNSTKEFTIIKFIDEQGYDMPNATLKPAVGDKYVLLDIKMPQTYIDTAETNLLAKAQAYLNNNCEPRVTYILEPDWRYFKTENIELKAGDLITIEDTDLGINVITRIVELTKSLANKYKYTLKLSDHLEPQLIQRLYSEQEGLKEKIEIGDVGDIIRSRWSWRTSEELRTMVFDTDGYFDMGNIRPASVETGMLSVGAKSTQFILKEVQIEANYTGDKSKFHASAGELIHLSIADEIRTWTLSENTQDSLVDATAYYIYAKCTKESTYTGQVIVDEIQRKFDDDPTYYYFLIGVLHSVVEGVRGVSLTYGQTIINGKFLSTGSITADRLNISNVADIGNIILGNTGYIRTTGKDSYASPTGSITNIIDYGATVPGTIKITSAIHNLSTGNVVVITGTTDYDGTYTITVIDANDYYVTATYVADETSGTWELSIGGIWLGYDVDKYKLNIGNTTNYLKWTGDALQIKGRLSVGAGTNEDIYFEDSGIRLYDYGQHYVEFYKPGLQSFHIHLDDNVIILGSSSHILISNANYFLTFPNEGQLGLPNLASDPTENNAIGQICMVGGILKRWDGNNWVTVAGGGGLEITDIDTSAKIAAIVTDETGTGALVFGVGPNLTSASLRLSLFDFNNPLTDDHAFSGLVDTQLVGENVAFGQLLYFNWTVKRWKLAKANGNATIPGLRIALESKADGQACLMLVKGYIRDDSAFEFAGAMVYVSAATAGAMTSTAPSVATNQVQRVGVAKTKDILFFDPSIDVGTI